MARLRKVKPRLAGRIELLEDRRVMSVDPLADLLAPVDSAIPPDDDAVAAALVDQHIQSEPDFWLETANPSDLDDAFDQAEEFLTAAHELTGWYSAQSYGLTGRGQTVAVIDSGIAWNHFALGGGLGAGYRVVGGWDFSQENDADPYDDGPSGSHGTHVSGIIGGNSATNPGVAPGVDFVGLRVFNDNGQGFYSWIENALRWIHNNRNSFANPITTVNISLGMTGWNSATIPEQATLEDELAQLKADGIFVAVSAGNSFANTGKAGLSYPAGSPHVVPVMSTNSAGALSSYSQRMSHAIAAPGENVISTVPDYKGNNNGVADDFRTKSGTSMAAPYVAGASVLIRQAMQMAGMTAITQDTIYNHMMATADTFFDAATNQSYKRLNLGRAIDALMATDDYGSGPATAYNLGVLTAPVSMSGQIGQASDVDCFSFTAASSGTVTFTTTSAQGFTPSWQVWGAEALPSAPGTVSFRVVAGQSYTVGLSSSSGTGDYTFASSFAAAFDFTEWGSVAYNQHSGLSMAGERWFRVTASRAGFLTVQGAFNPAAGAVGVAIYDANHNLVANGTTSGGQTRVDVNAAAGGVYFVRFTGTNSDVDVKLVNLVSQSGGVVTALGTIDADTIAFAAGATHTLTINGVSYTFAAGAAAQFNVDGLGGADSFVFVGTAGNESATVRVGSSTFASAGVTLNATNFESQAFTGNGGGDDATLFDSAGDDTFTATPTYATLTGAGFAMRVDDVDSVTAHSSTAGNQHDVALLYGSDGDDRFVSRASQSTLSGAGFRSVAHGFDRVEASAGGGNDQAMLYDSASDDVFAARPDYSVLSGDGDYNLVRGFDRVEAASSLGGWDRAYFNDSAGDDMFVGRPEYAYISGEGFYNFARGFDRVDAFALAGGRDRAYLYDSAGDDVFTGRPDYSLLEGAGFYNIQWSFDVLYTYATAGGRDVAYIYDSAGNDRYVAAPDYSYLEGDDYYCYAQFYEEVYAFAFAGGEDSATFYDSAGNDSYSCSTSGCTARIGGNVSAAYAFDNVTINATAGGVDRLDLRTVRSSDAFFGRGDEGTLSRGGSRTTTKGFDEIMLWLAGSGLPTIDVDAVDYVFDRSGN